MTKPPPIKTTDAQAVTGTEQRQMDLSLPLQYSPALLFFFFLCVRLLSVLSVTLLLRFQRQLIAVGTTVIRQTVTARCLVTSGGGKGEGGSKVNRVRSVDVVGFLLLLLLLSAHPLSLHSVISFFLQTQGFLNFLDLGSKRKRETDGQPSFSSLILLFLPPSPPPPPHVASLLPPDGPEPSGSGQPNVEHQLREASS